MSALYCGIDLHSNNGFYAIVEKDGKRVFGKRISNNIDKILSGLLPFKDRLTKIAVESTYNWYWLVDGLHANGYEGRVELANPAALEQYDGIKNPDDKTDAFFIADLMRLEILETGYIYPTEERFIRDILRRRSLFVKQRTAQILSLQNMISRQSGTTLSIRKMQKLQPDELKKILGNADNIFIAKENLDSIRFLSEKIKRIENYVLEKADLKPEFEKIMTVPGIGKILGLTIMYETGNISRFNKSGNYTSYCRCVKSVRTSNNKVKGRNNRKNGNKYLSWAYVEAAHKMKQFCPEAQGFYDKKFRKKCGAVATKALASKMSKSVYYILTNQEEFDIKKIFG